MIYRFEKVQSARFQRSCGNVIHIWCFHSNWLRLFRLKVLIQFVMYLVRITRKLFLWVVAQLNGQFSRDQLRFWFCLFMVYLTTVSVVRIIATASNCTAIVSNKSWITWKEARCPGVYVERLTNYRTRESNPFLQGTPTLTGGWIVGRTWKITIFIVPTRLN